MRRTKFHILSTVACAAVLLVSGCSDDTSARSSADGPGSAGSSPSSSEQQFPTAGASGPGAGLHPLPADELEQALLPLDELPSGYSQDPEDDTDSPVSYCGAKPDRAPDHAMHTFTKGGGFSTEIAQVGLSQYADTATAQEQFSRFETGIADCPGETVDGDAFTYRVTSTPDTGYPTFGLRVEGESFTLLLLASQVGPTVVTSGSGGLTSVDSDLAEDLLVAQIASYEEAARS